MVKITRITEGQKNENNATINVIIGITEKLRLEVEKFHGNYIKEAYNNSVSNLDVKNVKYFVKEEIKLGDDEMELIKRFREGTITIKEKKG